MINNLTGIRAFFAIWVLLFHIGNDYPGNALANGFFQKGYLGVDAFFILSGFILTHVYQQSLASSNVPLYIVKRFARIYPLHFICLLVFLAIGWIKQKLNPGLDLPWEETAQNFLLIHAWGTTEHAAWNWPSWSVSAEWFAYLFILPGLLIRSVKPAAKLALAALTWAALIAYSELSGVPGMVGYTTMGILRIVPEFLFGSFLYDVSAGEKVKGLVWINALSCVAAAAVILLMPGRMDYFLVPLFGLFIVNAKAGNGITNALFGNKVSVYLGLISYAIYITQGIVHSFLGYLVQSPMVQQKLDIGPELLGLLSHPLNYTLLTIALCLLLSMAMYHFIETPARRMITKWAGESRMLKKISARVP